MHRNLLSLVLGIFLTTTLFAQSTSIDSTFGTNGKYCPPFDPLDHTGDIYASLVLNNDDVIYSGVFTDTVGPNNVTRYYLSKINANGTPDASFGLSGRAVTISGASRSSGVETALAQQADGKIVFATYHTDIDQYVLSRYMANGVTDPSFGTVGHVHSGITSATTKVALLIQNDKILIASISGGNDPRYFIKRFNADGSVDTSFGAAGTSMSIQSSQYGSSPKLQLQSDDKILLCGHARGDQNQPFIQRYSSDGTLDSSYGTSGTQYLATQSNASVRAVGIQSDDKLILAGNRHPGGYLLTRLNTDGSYDTGFGIEGHAAFFLNELGTTSGFNGERVEVLSDGRIAVSYTAHSSPLVVLFHADGTPDRTFGHDGIAGAAVTHSSLKSYVHLQSSDRILISSYQPVQDFPNVSPAGRCYTALKAPAFTSPSGTIGLTMCSTTYTWFDLGRFITAERAHGASSYEFEFVNVDTDDTLTAIRSNPVVRLNTVTGIEYGARYDIRVRYYLGSAWSAYGGTCKLRTFKSTWYSSLKPAYCGASNYEIENPIEGTLIEDTYNGEDLTITSYQWRFIDHTDNKVHLYNPPRSANNVIQSLQYIHGLRDGRTYTIQIRAILEDIYYAYGDWGPACTLNFKQELPKTKLEDQYCGSSNISLGQIVAADEVATAEDYEWKFVDSADLSTYTHIAGEANRFLHLPNVAGLKYGRTYNVQIRVKVGGEWGEFNVTCKIRTIQGIPLSKLEDAFCGATEISLGQWIHADEVPGAEDYEWKFVDQSDNSEHTYLSGTGFRFMQLNMIGTIGYNKTYNVQVRAKVGGTWGEFGQVCTLATLATAVQTQLSSAFCGGTDFHLNQIVSADYVSGAQDYEWEFEDQATAAKFTYAPGYGYRFLTLRHMGTLGYNKTYNVRVRARVAGVWADFGPTCTLSTLGAVPTTELRASDCGASGLSTLGLVAANEVPGASHYEWEFTDQSTSQVLTHTVAYDGFRFLFLIWISGLQQGHTYDVRVRAQVNGVWGAFGNTCSLNFAAPAPAPIEQSAVLDGSMITTDIKVYPNPYNGGNLNVVLPEFEESATLHILDMQGRTVYNATVNVAGLVQLEDVNLSTGLYIVRVQAHDQVWDQKLLVQ